MDINKFSSEFFKFQPVPMTEQQSKCMINLILLERDGNIPEEGKATFEFRVTKSRADYLGLEITDAAVMMIAVMCTSPGEIVMYLVAIRSKTKVLDIEKLLAHIFPVGFPSHAHLNNIWNMQKTKNGNFVDTVNSSSF